ncbi:MAG: hypothetical protein ACR2HR_02250 [Euzebya sp.]
MNNPPGADDKTVAALGTMDEALDTIERARGRLYDFHHLTGHADDLLGQAVQQLREAGHDLQADRLQTEVVGRNVLSDRWTFQIVEEYDSGYWSIARDLAAQVRDDLAGGARHVHEAQMKAERTTPGHPGHTMAPEE